MKHPGGEKKWCLENGKPYNTTSKHNNTASKTADYQDRLTQTVKIIACSAMAFKFILYANGSQPYHYIRIIHGYFEKCTCPNMTFRVIYVVVLEVQSKPLML